MKQTQEFYEAHVGTLVKALNWLAAVLGIGTFAGMVNIVVGILSATWIAYQLWAALRYDLPMKRLKLAAARRKLMEDSTQPGDLR